MKLGTWEASVKAKDPKARLSSLQFFIIGAISKTIATIVTYPYIMAKTRLQSKYSENSGVPKYKDTMDVLAKVYQAEGIVGWVSVPPFFFFFQKVNPNLFFVMTGSGDTNFQSRPYASYPAHGQGGNRNVHSQAYGIVQCNQGCCRCKKVKV